jgi:hypothetical protein
MAGACTFLAGLFCVVIWIFAKSYGVVIFFALITGTVSGTQVPHPWHQIPDPLTLMVRFWATAAPVGAEVVGLKILPSALSVLWLVLVLPCTFSEPIGLKLRATSGDIYLHAQLFTGFMYIGAAVCMWFLRAWKIAELERLKVGKEERERDIRDDDQVIRDREGGRPGARRTESVKSVFSPRGFWSWQRV